MYRCEKCGATQPQDCACTAEGVQGEIGQCCGAPTGLGGDTHKAPAAVVTFSFYDNGQVTSSCVPVIPNTPTISTGTLIAVQSAQLLTRIAEDLLSGGTLGTIASVLSDESRGGIVFDLFGSEEDEE